MLMLDIKKGLNQIYGEEFPVEIEVSNILQEVDLDKNGFIDYTGNVKHYLNS